MTFQQNVRKPFLNYVLLDRYFALEVFFFPEIELLDVFFPGQLRPGNRTGAHSRVQRIPMAYEPLKKKTVFLCRIFALRTSNTAICNTSYRLSVRETQVQVQCTLKRFWEENRRTTSARILCTRAIDRDKTNYRHVSTTKRYHKWRSIENYLSSNAKFIRTRSYLYIYIGLDFELSAERYILRLSLRGTRR